MMPTASWPIVNPAATGYSPRTMCRSVPHIVVSRTWITASPGPALGMGFSSRPNLLGARKTLACITPRGSCLFLRSCSASGTELPLSSGLFANVHGGCQMRDALLATIYGRRSYGRGPQWGKSRYNSLRFALEAPREQEAPQSRG